MWLKNTSGPSACFLCTAKHEAPAQAPVGIRGLNQGIIFFDTRFGRVQPRRDKFPRLIGKQWVVKRGFKRRLAHILYVVAHALQKTHEHVTLSGSFGLAPGDSLNGRVAVLGDLRARLYGA